MIGGLPSGPRFPAGREKIHRRHRAIALTRNVLRFLDRAYVEVLDKRKKIIELLEENEIVRPRKHFLSRHAT